MINIAIIGGGISGLYTAFKLYKKYDNIQITLYEKNNYLGGRIHTIYKTNYKNKLHYDAGAGRFSNKHKYLLKLIKDLNIEDQIFQHNKEPKTNLLIKDNQKTQFNVDNFIKILLEKTKNIPIKILKSKTLLLLMYEFFTNTEIKDFMDAYGYHNDFEACNAYDLLEGFKKPEHYFGLKSGMSIIVQKLIEILKNYKIIIHLSHEILNVDLENLILTTNFMENIKYHKIFFCITKNDMLKIPGLVNNKEILKTLNTITTKPLNRVYAQFPLTLNNKNEVWFHDFESRIYTDNPIGSIIPINKDTGLIMLSYSDSINAETWNYFNNKNEFNSELMKNIRKLFPDKIIPDPLWIENYYWENATHWPNPYYKDYKNNNKNYFLVGETMTKRFNAWTEGALLSVEKLFKYLKL